MEPRSLVRLSVEKPHTQICLEQRAGNSGSVRGGHESKTSPARTTENSPGHPSWVYSTENTSHARNDVSQSHMLLGSRGARDRRMPADHPGKTPRKRFSAIWAAPLGRMEELWVVARSRQPHIGSPGLTSWDILSRPSRDCSWPHLDPGLASWATFSRPCGTDPDTP
jgi:hypothetical protein